VGWCNESAWIWQTQIQKGRNQKCCKIESSRHVYCWCFCWLTW
jgi:hypothetical protein